ncbi:HAD hydrolase family protein [Candidatus Woesearchaeota archaeon]|nr:HAD hydrolase family protein [Candidatus Woesearchaeota archaeon]
MVHVPTDHDSEIQPEELVDVGGRRYIYRKTQQYLKELQQQGLIVVLVSGMRMPSYRGMVSHILHDYAAIEDGSLLLSKDGRPDPEWVGILTAELVFLNSYKQELRNLGLVIDDLDRTASFRVDPKANDRNDLEQLASNFPELNEYPKQLRRTEHKPYPPVHACYQFVPVSGGKVNAIEFVMARLGLSWGNVAAFGDDLNDMEMMERAAYPTTLLGANDAIQRMTYNRGGLVAPSFSHKGTITALSKLVELVKAQ